MRMAFLSAGIALAACASPEVQQFRDDAGVTFAECDEVTLGAECPPEGTFRCIRDAFTACSPAHVAIHTQDRLGNDMDEDVFVRRRPSDQHCEVVIFLDDPAIADEHHGAVSKLPGCIFAAPTSCDRLALVCEG